MSAAGLRDPSRQRWRGVDTTWSRTVDVRGEDGERQTWHVLDTSPAVAEGESGAGEPVGTLLCVHGNPTWSYLWRRFLAGAPAGWRVVAVDQLGMGWSSRHSRPRRLAERVDDLSRLTERLGITGPVVTLAHDWGGPISLGWALAHRSQLRGLVLANTSVAFPPGDAGPLLIRLASSAALRQLVCVRTPAFVRATTALSRPPLPAGVRAAFAAPYRSAERRRAVGDFVADIPFAAGHPSRPTLESIAARLEELAGIPALLLWGPRDPVFQERYLRDLMARLPHADVHRYEGAAHLVTEDRPETAEHVWRWVAGLPRDEAPAAPPPPASPRPAGAPEPLWSALTARAGDPSPAVVEMSGTRRTVSFALLEQRVRELAAGLAAAGVRRGDRVALLVPPGADLTLSAYACWRAGAVIVVADAGLGVRGMGRALRGAAPDHVIGIARGLAAAAAMGVPGRRILVGAMPRGARRALGVEHSLGDLVRLGRSSPDLLPRMPDAVSNPGDECAVLFTSGATGPAKGVVYRHGQVGAQVAALRGAYRIGERDRFVAAFAPFALYGPALGIATAVPDMDVMAPASLTAGALADAAAAVDATFVFASPAALRNVAATADGLDDGQRAALAAVRLVTSAGAPVPVALLRQVRALMPSAEPHTPYGMTEALPVADISLTELEAAGAGEGVCVGRPLPGVELAVSPLTPDGLADGPLTADTAVTGEVCVRASHVKDRYDRLWATQQASARNPGWHRTGDVGHLDGDGRLWVEGRLVHVVATASGAVTPVGLEQRVETLEGVRAAAVVGVGPRGTQQVAVVVVPEGRPPRRSHVLAEETLASRVRSIAETQIAAVLVSAALPVDIRHQSKVDRAAVARWAERVLAGERPPRLGASSHRARRSRPGSR